MFSFHFKVSKAASVNHMGLFLATGWANVGPVEWPVFTMFSYCRLIDSDVAAMAGESQSKTNQFVQKAGQIVRRFLTKYWIWVVAIILFTIGITGQRMTVFRIIYMALALIFILTFQVTSTVMNRYFDNLYIIVNIEVFWWQLHQRNISKVSKCFLCCGILNGYSKDWWSKTLTHPCLRIYIALCPVYTPND